MHTVPICLHSNYAAQKKVDLLQEARTVSSKWLIEFNGSVTMYIDSGKGNDLETLYRCNKYDFIYIIIHLSYIAHHSKLYH